MIALQRDWSLVHTCVTWANSFSAFSRKLPHHVGEMMDAECESALGERFVEAREAGN